MSDHIEVTRTRISGTDTVVYAAYEPSEYLSRHGIFHTFFHTFAGECHGRIGPDPDPALYEHLEVGPKRFEAVEAAYEARSLVAYAAIRRAFPEAEGRHIHGEVVMQNSKLENSRVRLAVS